MWTWRCYREQNDRQVVRLRKMECRACGAEFPEQRLVICEDRSPKLKGDGEVRLRFSFCSRCWRDPDRRPRLRSAFEAARRELLAAGADSLWKRHGEIVSYPPEAALPWPVEAADG